jgi:hypothetical protein
MTSLPLVDTLLWLLAAAGVVWAAVTPLCTVLGWSRFHGTAEENPAAVTPPPADADYDQKYRTLLRLGFRPAGVLIEHNWRVGFDWYRPFPIRSLSSADGTCFAGLYRLAAEPVRVKFDSLTSGGHIIRTVLPGTGPECRAGRLTRVEIPGRDVPTCYARHRALVAQIASERHETIAQATLQDWAHLDSEEQQDLVCGLAALHFMILPAVFFLVPGLLVVLLTHLVWGPDVLPRGTAVSVRRQLDSSLLVSNSINLTKTFNWRSVPTEAS